MQDLGFDDPLLRPMVDSGANEQKRIIPSLDIQARTVASNKHPDRNEDTMFILPERKAVGVFDGISRHAAGDKASRIAKDQVGGALQELDDGLSVQQVEDAIRQAIINANNEVYKQAQTENNNMGTTASMVYIWEGGKGERKAIVGNVGDSRVYLLRNNRLEQITLDDSEILSILPNERQARQLQLKLSNVTDPQTQLTASEQALFNRRNIIIQALGRRPSVEPKIHTIDFLPSDRILVCSDGISENLTDNEIQQILGQNPNNTEAVRGLMEASQARSKSNHIRAKPDDMTAIVIGEIGVPKEEVVQPSSQEEQKANRLPKGLSVRVQRDDGTFESGWVVDESDLSSDTVVVINKEKGLKKRVYRATLERLNRPATIYDIPHAENLQQLNDILNQMGGLQGSQDFYRSTELIRIISDVMEGRVPLERITGTGGLRQKVGKLIELMKIRKKV